MDISALTSAGTTSTGSDAASRVNSTDFMRLLTTQLKNQNPLEPVQDAEFLGQLAQFSTLEEMKGQRGAFEALAATMQASASLQSLAQATNLIGREISYADPTSGSEVLSGRVSSVRFGATGIHLDLADGASVPLGLVLQIHDGASGAGTTPPTTTVEPPVIPPTSGSSENGNGGTSGNSATASALINQILSTIGTAN